MRRIILLCLIPSLALADERHVVKPNETCASIAQQHYGDARLVDILHRANPTLAASPPPHVLREGMVLVIPPQPSAPAASPDAQLTRVRNRVDVINPETKEGKPNDPLFRGNRVSTQEASAADVTFRDESQVKLGERTLVVILGDAHSAAAPPQTSLMTGGLRAFIAKEPKKVVTPAANVTVSSGQAQVTSDAAQTTRLAVYAGRSTIDARGTTREVTPGFGSKAELGKAPTQPHPLPAAPIWTGLPPSVLLDQGSGAPSIIGTYDAKSGTSPAEWHVQVARDDAFDEILADSKAPAEKHRFEGKLPSAGHFFIRVSAIDADQFESPFGTTAHVLVIRVTSRVTDKRRQIHLDPVDAPCFRVGNVRLTRIHGSLEVRANEPIHLRCAVMDGEPTTLFTL
jgi:hypothetical protein